MKLLLKVLSSVMILCLLLIAAGCSAEKILEKVLGVEIAISEGNSDSGYYGSDLDEWDKNEMHGLEKPNATIQSGYSTVVGSGYFLEDMSEAEAQKVIQAIKDLGFTENSKETENSYHGEKNNNYIDFVLYEDNQAEISTGNS